MKHFYKMRVKPDGVWVVCGPYDDYDSAMAARKLSKAIDTEVTSWFAAESRAAAEIQEPTV